MPRAKRKISPENLYSLIQKGSIEKAQALESILNSEEEVYDPIKDYYKRFKDAVCRCLKRNSLIELPHELRTINFKNETKYNSFLMLAHSMIDIFEGYQLENPNHVSCKKALSEEVLVSTPCHLSIEVNKKRWLIWLYCNKAPLPYERIQIQLHLMGYLSPVEGVPTIVDVQRGIVYQVEESLNIFSFIIKQDLDFIINYLNSQNMAA